MGILNDDSEWGLCMGISNGDYKWGILNGDFKWRF